MKHQKPLTIGLAVLLVIAVLFIGITQISDSNTQKLQIAYQQGAQIGYEQAIMQLMQQLSTCQPVPLYVGNASMNAVAVECLQQAEG